MAQSTNLPIVSPADSFDQRVQDYFTNYFTAPIKMTDQEYEAAKSFFVILIVILSVYHYGKYHLL